MIRALLFDIGNVIIPIEPRRAFDALSSHCPFEWQEARQRLFASEAALRYELGLIDSAAFVAELRSLLHLDCDDAAIRSAWCAMSVAGTLLPESLFAALAEQKRLVLVSNTNELHFEAHRAAWPHFAHFHAAVLSYREGCRKPSRQFFSRARDEAGCAPEECFYIDDSSEYVTAAREWGIDGLVFTSEKELRAALEARGVL
ncbi:MAG: HAD family phosphatase [Bryobacteraceae bacterium]|nr:HAD family phosphatase [Bryobacteraceae bacterium]